MMDHIENYHTSILYELHAISIYYLLIIMLGSVLWVVLRFCGLPFEGTSFVLGVPAAILFWKAYDSSLPKRLKSSSKAVGTHKCIFESLPFLIGNLPSMCLSSSGALSNEDDTINNVSEMEGDVRVIQLSELFDPETLETRLPWAGPALRLVKAAGETPESDTIYIGAVDTREEVHNQHGVLRVLLITPNGKQAELHLSALRPSGIFEGEHLNNNWLQYTLRIFVEDKEGLHRNALPG
jgi:hypothetical protein